MNRVSKPFYFGTYAAATVASWLFLAAYNLETGGRMDTQLSWLTLASGLIGLYVTVVLMLFLYRMWQVLPPETARTSPGMAAGLLLVPLFSLYWFFPAFWGWTRDWNAYASRSEGRLLRAPEGLALAFCILTCLGTVTGTAAGLMKYAWPSLVFGVPGGILMMVFLYRACDLVNSAPELPVRTSFTPDGDSFGVASLALGLASIPYVFLGFFLGIAAIVFAMVQRKVGMTGMALAGLITGIVGTLLWGLGTVVLVVVGVAAGMD